MTIFVVDQGDGWWDCPSPLKCRIIDGPGEDPDSGPGVTHLLLMTEEPIEWHGDSRYIDRWGPDHPLCQAIAPTSRLLLMASSRDWAIDLQRGWSIPATPVVNEADSVAEAETAGGLTAKVAVSNEEGATP